MIERVNEEVKKYFESKPLLSKLLNFDVIFIYSSLVIMIINVIAHLGGFVNELVMYAFLFGVLLCLANNNFNTLMLGFGAKAIVEFANILFSIFSKYEKYRVFHWDSLFALFLSGFFAYMAYKKTQVEQESDNSNI